MARARVHNLTAVQREMFERVKLVRRSVRVAAGASIYVIKGNAVEDVKSAAPEHMQSDPRAMKKWVAMYSKYARKMRGSGRTIDGGVKLIFGQRGAKYYAIEHGGDYRQYVLSYPRKSKTGGFHAVRAHARFRRGFPAQKIWDRIVSQHANTTVNRVFDRALNIAVQQKRVPGAVELRAGL